MTIRALRFAPIALAFVTLSAGWTRQGTPAYRNARAPVEARVRDLLGRMTPKEKFFQLYMSPGDRDDVKDDWSNGAFGLQIGAAAQPAGTPREEVVRRHAARVTAIQRYFVDSTRLGIPIFAFDEAVHGLMRDGAVVYPAAIGIAATFDTSAMQSFANAVAAETRARGVRDVLSPVINIATDVRWGRVEETYGEDPFLTSAMARVYVREFTKAGIVTTPKHFVANVGDGGRDSHPIALDRHALEETHFPPFVEAIRAGAKSVMTAYNSVGGLPATQNRFLLTDVLRREWKFGGFVISDAAATGGATVLHFTEPDTPTAAKHAWEAGLDVVFQSTWAQHRPYLQAIERGLVAPAIIDSAVAHVLRVKFAMGLFEHPYGDADDAARLAADAAGRDLAADIAAKSFVLVKNANRTLPLDSTAHRVALIGVDAAEARLGGYSANGAAGQSILTAMRAKLGDARVAYAPGPGRLTAEYAIVPESALSLRGEYWDNPTFTGAPRVTRPDAAVNFGWTLSSPARGIPFYWYGVRWTGSITAPSGGVRRIGVEGNDGWRLWIDGALAIDNWAKASYRAKLAEVSWASGSKHDIRLEFHENTGNARVKLVWEAGARADWRASIDSAVRAAASSDAAVVVVGVEEGEFRDRSTLALPGHQEALIEAVAAVGKPTIVILVGGSAVTGGAWLDKVGALLDIWYPGERGGDAVVRTLFGESNPSGRLPITFAMRDGQLPLSYNHLPTGRGDDYVDGTGMALFPFGHGLTYTTFEYSALTLARDTIGTHDSVDVQVTVKNTGDREGREVVQLYIRDELASVARPVMQLAGFTAISLYPGATQVVRFSIGPTQLALLDKDLKRIVEPGRFRLMVGASSKDIRQRAFLIVR